MLKHVGRQIYTVSCKAYLQSRFTVIRTYTRAQVLETQCSSHGYYCYNIVIEKHLGAPMEKKAPS